MGYVLGCLFFLGVIGYFILRMVIFGAAGAAYAFKSIKYKKYSTDRYDDSIERQKRDFLAVPLNLDNTLRRISEFLGPERYYGKNGYEFFSYRNLSNLSMNKQKQIALEFLLSERGISSRYMAEMGCYRIPENSSRQDKKAMLAYMNLLQQRIQLNSGKTIWCKEMHWQGDVQNYVWQDSPADPDYWKGNKARNSGYQCIYRNGAP